MEISREEFERVIELSYKRGRITSIGFIEQSEIDDCVSGIYKLLDIQPDADEKKKEKNNDKVQNKTSIN